MPQGAFFEKRPINAPGLVAVIAIHAAVLTAVAMSKMEVIPFYDPPLTVTNVPLPPEPRPIPEPKTREPDPNQQQQVTRTKPEIETPIDRVDTLDRLPPLPPLGPDVIETPPAPPIDPPAPPVRIAAVMDRGVDVQPGYPASEQRMGVEGEVVIRVLIGAEGRVKAAAKVSATSDAFYRATERQALRHWRFKPATLDGRPVESWQEVSVRFRLDV